MPDVSTGTKRLRRDARASMTVDSVPLTISRAPGGCLPGYLECVCGHAALAMWHPTFGAMCERCERCWAFPGGYKGPQRYFMRPTDPVAALLA